MVLKETGRNEKKLEGGEVWTIPRKVYDEYMDNYGKEPTPREMLDYIVVMGYINLRHRL